MLEGFCEIISAAQNLGADLIIMGSHGRTGFKKFIFRQSSKVLGESHILVLVVMLTFLIFSLKITGNPFEIVLRDF